MSELWDGLLLWVVVLLFLVAVVTFLAALVNSLLFLFPSALAGIAGLSLFEWLAQRQSERMK